MAIKIGIDQAASAERPVRGERGLQRHHAAGELHPARRNRDPGNLLADIRLSRKVNDSISADTGGCDRQSVAAALSWPERPGS